MILETTIKKENVSGSNLYDKSKSAFLESKMSEYWGERSDSYSDQNLSQLFGEKRLAWENLIFGKIGETRKLRVLDIGTGPGFFAILSALRGHETFAVDMNEGMLEKAAQNAAQAGVSINFVKVGNLLPFKNESFDLIVSRDVTWTLTDPENQMIYWANKLKKGGTMMYFDSEWYYYLKDNEKRKAWEKQRKEVIAQGGFSYSKSHELEALALNLPMTYKERPEWDKSYWNKYKNFKVDVVDCVNSYVYSDKEKMQYKDFPEFLITVRRHF